MMLSKFSLVIIYHASCCKDCFPVSSSVSSIWLKRAFGTQLLYPISKAIKGVLPFILHSTNVFNFMLCNHMLLNSSCYIIIMFNITRNFKKTEPCSCSFDGNITENFQKLLHCAQNHVLKPCNWLFNTSFYMKVNFSFLMFLLYQAMEKLCLSLTR